MTVDEKGNEHLKNKYLTKADSQATNEEMREGRKPFETDTWPIKLVEAGTAP